MTARRAIEPDEDDDRPPARAKGWIALVVSLAVIFGGGGLAFLFARDAVQGWFAPSDFPGPGGEGSTSTSRPASARSPPNASPVMSPARPPRAGSASSRSRAGRRSRTPTARRGSARRSVHSG